MLAENQLLRSTFPRPVSVLKAPPPMLSQQYQDFAAKWLP